MRNAPLPDSVWKRYTSRRTPFTGNSEHAEILMDSLEHGGVGRWNRWRKRARGVAPDLSGMSLGGRDLSRADFHRANLSNSELNRVNLFRADLHAARLRDANLFMANLFRANAAGADFRGAYLHAAVLAHADCTKCDFRGLWTDVTNARLCSATFTRARLNETNLSTADLSNAIFDDADLRGAQLNGAVLEGTKLRGARLRGAELTGAFIRRAVTDRRTQQKSLLVDFNIWSARKGWLSSSEPPVNDIQVAQFYNVVSEPGSIGKFITAGQMSVVLILGRFTPRRKRVLEHLRWALRARGKNAVVFDFPSPENRELSDTVRFVAGLSQFVVVDLSEPSSVPLEMQAFIPGLMVPVVTIIERGRTPFAMFADLLRRYYWVLPPLSYRTSEQLVRHVDSAIVDRAAKASRQIAKRRRIALSSYPSVGR